MFNEQKVFRKPCTVGDIDCDSCFKIVVREVKAMLGMLSDTQLSTESCHRYMFYSKQIAEQRSETL